MTLTPEAEALLARLAGVAPADDVAEVRVAATLEAARLRHEHVVPGHVLTILVRGGADADLLRSLDVDPDATPAQLLDRTKTEVDAAMVAPPASRGAAGSKTPATATRSAVVPSMPCPACGDTGPRGFQTRRIPNPEGGRGAITARVVVCGACGAAIGPG